MATTLATSLELICATCSKPVEPGDRFCPSCGSATVEPTAQSGRARTAAGSPDELDALLATIETRIDWHQLLAVHRPFCRSCGIDHDTSETDCPACGVTIAPLPGHVTGTLGLVYPLRRTIRKRPAVRVGDDGDAARLLLESGEIESVEISKLPEPLPPPTANGLPSTMRTPHGSLLRLVAAGQAGALKSKWDADALTTAALAAVGDITTARLVALDALALGQIELLRRLPLTEPECLWLRPCHAAAAADHVEAIAAIAELPPAGHREKLAILAAAVPPARADGLDLASLEPQLAAFTEAEPLARLLSGALGFAPAQAAATEDSLLNVEGIPDSLAAELSAVRTALAGRSAARSALAYLPTNSPVVLALTNHRQGLVRPADIDHIALSLLDDLIDDGAIDRDGALAGSTDAERTRYLLARLAPERLTDDDIEHLGHAGERVRRAFRHADLEA